MSIREVFKNKNKQFFGAEEVEIDTVLEKKNKQIKDLIEENHALRSFINDLMSSHFHVNDFNKSIIKDFADKKLMEENEYLQKELTNQTKEYFYNMNNESMEKVYMVNEEDYQNIKDYNQLIEVLKKLKIKI